MNECAATIVFLAVRHQRDSTELLTDQSRISRFTIQSYSVHVRQSCLPPNYQYKSRCLDYSRNLPDCNAAHEKIISQNLLPLATAGYPIAFVRRTNIASKCSSAQQNIIVLILARICRRLLVVSFSHVVTVIPAGYNLRSTYFFV